MSFGFPIAVGAVVAVGGAVCVFIAQGCVSALVTERMGRLGKNRNVAAAVVASMLSAFLGIAILYPVLILTGGGHVETMDLAMAALALILPGVIAVTAAGIIGAKEVHEAKFCEDCKEHMEAKELATFPLGVVKALAAAMREGNVRAAADLMREAAGGQGKVKLFSCKGCGKGYAELTALFKAAWLDKGKVQSKTANWLAGSVALSTEEVELIRTKAHTP